MQRGGVFLNPKHLKKYKTPALFSRKYNDADIILCAMWLVSGVFLDGQSYLYYDVIRFIYRVMDFARL